MSTWSQGITFWSASSSTYWECRDRPVAGPVALGSPTASSLCSELVGDVLGEAPARPAHEGRREVECVAPRSERLEQLLRTQIVVSILYPSLKLRIDAAEPHRYGGSVPGSGIAT